MMHKISWDRDRVTKTEFLEENRATKTEFLGADKAMMYKISWGRQNYDVQSYDMQNFSGQTEL